MPVKKKLWNQHTSLGVAQGGMPRMGATKDRIERPVGRPRLTDCAHRQSGGGAGASERASERRLRQAATITLHK